MHVCLSIPSTQWGHLILRICLVSWRKQAVCSHSFVFTFCCCYLCIKRLNKTVFNRLYSCILLVSDYSVSHIIYSSLITVDQYLSINKTITNVMFMNRNIRGWQTTTILCLFVFQGMLVKLEVDIVSFFKEWPQSVYVSNLSNSYERMMLHALCQYLELISKSKY